MRNNRMTTVQKAVLNIFNRLPGGQSLLSRAVWFVEFAEHASQRDWADFRHELVRTGGQPLRHVPYVAIHATSADGVNEDASVNNSFVKELP